MRRITKILGIGGLKPQHHFCGAWKQQYMVTKSQQTQYDRWLEVGLYLAANVASVNFNH